jgi:hypothetical protein
MSLSAPSPQDYLDANIAIGNVLDPDAQLSGTNTAPAGLTPLNLPNQTKLEDTANGFYAQAYIENSTGNIIIAFDSSVIPGSNDPRSTDDPTYSSGSQAADGINDSEIVLGKGGILEGTTPAALLDASSFANAVQSYVDASAISQQQSLPQIFVTGFSLGGTEAEKAAQALGLGSGGISGGVTFGATGLPGYSSTTASNNSAFVNYVNFGDAVGNYAKDGELSEVSFTGDHFGSVVFVGNTLDQDSLRDFADLLHAESPLSGITGLGPLSDVATIKYAASRNNPLAMAELQSLQETTITHSLSGVFSYATYYAPTLEIGLQGPAMDFGASYLPGLTQIIAAKTQPTGTPLPPPGSTVYSVTPSSPVVSENSGTLDFTIARTDSTNAATVLVSTIQDQGFANPNGNFYYDGLLNDPVTFATGQSTVQVVLTINDQQLTSGNETFRLAVQQNATDPIGTYLATTNFTIASNDPEIIANATINEGINTSFQLAPFLSLSVPTSGKTISLVDFINTKSGPGLLTDAGATTPADVAVGFANIDNVGFSTGAVAGSDKIEVIVDYSDGSTSSPVDLTINTTAAPPSPPAPPISSSGPVVNPALQQFAVTVGQTGELTSAILDTTDAAYPDPSQISYTILTAPSKGVILDNGQLAHSFTQADVDAGLVSYQSSMQAGLSAITTDSFSYEVSDASFRYSPIATVSLEINPLPAPPQTSEPYVDTLSIPTLSQGGQEFITGDDLHVTDPNPNIPPAYQVGSGVDQAITYNVVTPPVHGELVWFTTGNQDATHQFDQPVSTFSQSDVNNGWIVYKSFDTSGASDSFSFTVSDGFGGAVGPTTATIPVQPVDPVILYINSGIFVTPDGTSAINPSWLQVYDTVPNAPFPTFVVEQNPAHGSLLLSGVPTTSFTQLDIDRGLVTYQSTDPTAISDQFTLSVSPDAYGNTIANLVVPVAIATSALDQNTGAVVGVGQSVTLTSANLDAADPGLRSANPIAAPTSAVVFTLTGLPMHGAVSVGGETLQLGGQFTQQDLDSNLVTYSENGASATSDSFSFSIQLVDGSAPPKLGVGTFDIDVANADGGQILSGSATPQILYSGPGNNWITGGVGTILSYAAAPAGVTVNLDTGTAANGFGGTDTLTNIHSVIGSAHDDTFIAGDPDTFTGGGGEDTFEGTGANLNGSTITDLMIGDKIVITDANLTNFSFQQGDAGLTFEPGMSVSQASDTIKLPNMPAGQFAISADPVGGVDLTFVASFNFNTVDVPYSADTKLLGINDEDQIVGSIASSGETSTGFLDVGGTFTTIAFSNNPDYELASGTEATGINNSGLIVGTYQVPSGYGGFYEYGFSYLASSNFYNPPFEPPYAGGGTFAAGVNDEGQIVGHAGGGGFLDTDGTFTTINDPLGIGGSTATDINNLGQIVGNYSGSENGPGDSFLDVDGIFTTIDDPQAVYGTDVEGINNKGQIVGHYVDADGVAHGFLDSGGSFTTIDDPNATAGTFIQGINDEGEIVGYYNDAEGAHGFTAEAACYRAGTRILTERGELRIEELSVGMKLIAATGESRKLIWIGHRTIDCTRHPRPYDVWPVCVEAGAFGGGRPQRNLWLSPGHSVFVDGVLIPIVRLINGATVAQLSVDTVTYFHVELESHDVILAEGLPAESYLDTGNRNSFIEGGGALDLYADFSPKIAYDYCASFHESGLIVASVKTRLLAQARAFGHMITSESNVHILADGQRITAQRIDGERYLFDLRARRGDIRLMSRRWVPAHVLPESEDVRELGVCVRLISINGCNLRLDDVRLAGGWHCLENGLDDHRWTNGAARLPAGTESIAIDLCGAQSYWLENPAVAGEREMAQQGQIPNVAQ